jgi:hypothetical protein
MNYASFNSSTTIYSVLYDMNKSKKSRVLVKSDFLPFNDYLQKLFFSFKMLRISYYVRKDSKPWIEHPSTCLDYII